MTGHRFSGWIVPLLAALVVSFSAPASAARWEPLSLWGGEVQVAAARGDSRILYAASPSSGLYRSLDGGASWQHRSLGPKRGRVQIAGVDPHDTSRLYGLVDNDSELPADLYRSDDGGLHWRRSNAGLRRFVFNLAFDPKTPGRLYAATDAGLYRSDDRGKTWGRIAFAGEPVLQVSVAPRDPRVVLAAVQTDDFGSTWRSADGGATFSEVLDRAVQEHAFDPTHPGRLYGLDSYFHLQRSDDLGATWTDLTSLTGSLVSLEALTVTPAGTLLAGSINQGVMRSVDGGLTWSEGGRQVAPVDRISSLVVGKDGVVLAGGGRGVWKSLSDGQGWRAASTGILGQWTLALEAGTDSTVWTSVGNGFFTSPDAGESFRSHAGALGNVGFLQHLAVHPLQPQVAYAFGCCVDGDSGLFKTEDGGRTWERLPYTGSLRDVAVVAVDPVDPDIVYGGGFFHPHAATNCTAARSTDGGATWSCISSSNFTELAIDPRDPRILYALLSGVLHRSPDRGQTWKKVSAKARALDHLTLDPTKPGRFFALSRIGPGIWRSEDGGRRWTLLAAGLPEPGFVNDLLLDPSRPDRIWIAVEVFDLFGQVERSATRIFRSDDAGAHWTEVSDGLAPGVVVYRLAANPEAADVLYAGTAGQGLYRLVVED